jgi:hypothetical protein
MSPGRQNPERVAQSDEWTRRSGVCRHVPWPGRDRDVPTAHAAPLPLCGSDPPKWPTWPAARAAPPAQSGALSKCSVAPTGDVCRAGGLADGPPRRHPGNIGTPCCGILRRRGRVPKPLCDATLAASQKPTLTMRRQGDF